MVSVLLGLRCGQKKIDAMTRAVNEVERAWRGRGGERSSCLLLFVTSFAFHFCCCNCLLSAFVIWWAA